MVVEPLDRSYELLGQLVALDFDLSHRRSTRPSSHELDAAAAIALTCSTDKPIVYTAFDGDHFELCGHMREIALSHGFVPANPESILGYKETVTARLEKRGVLVDDLAVLRGCDRLWVFTDLAPEPESLQCLAEGVVVEILYFLRRRPRPDIRFISPRAVMAASELDHRPYAANYDESKAALHPDQKEAVLALANADLSVDQELPPLIYHIHDPLDFKYAHWLRPYPYDKGYLPLVPGLAVELRDVAGGYAALGQVFVAWARLCSLATSAWVLPPMDADKSPSAVSGVLERVWRAVHGAHTLSVKRWSDYRIPKARAGVRWPLTRKEGSR